MEELQQNYTLTTPISTSDQAMFHRVWDRVMASSPSDSAPLPLPVPTVPAPEVVPKPAQQTDLPSLGDSSAQYADLLRQMLSATHSLWQSYQALTRQSQGLAARQLRILSEESLEQLRQLNAVYFLLTGNRYSPANHTVPTRQSLLLSLRELFMGEQRWQQTFHKSAQEVCDPCLQQLFEELAMQAQRHMNAIRRILERL